MIRSLAVYLLFTILLSSSTFAQRPPCFSLKGSQTCPDLQSFYVRSVSDFNSVASFDSYMRSQFDNTTAYRQAFQSGFGCPGWDGSQQRFHISTTCFYFVQVGECPENPPVTPMCKTECDAFINSMQTIFQNTTFCPTAGVSQQVLQARQASVSPTGNAFADFCSKRSDAQPCARGLEFEFNQCGFFNAADNAAFCANPANSKQECCTAGTLTALQAVADSLAPVDNRPWIYSGIALGAMTVGALFFIFCVKVKPWRKSSTSAIAPPESDLKPLPIERTLTRNQTNKGKRQSLFQAVRQSIFGGGRNKVNPPPPLPMTNNNNKYPQSMYSVPGDQTYASTPVPMPTYQNQPYQPPQQQQQPQQQYAEYPVGNTFQMRVIDPYSAQLGDELSLEMGDFITIEEEFDDGWAVGRNESTGDVGAFPMSCLVSVDEYESLAGVGMERKSVVSQRGRSLYASGFR
ncbi:hypothetical protein HDU85_003832 [Gaertneriomyces sp. JEL0708]|nr:hypothetical protein HDU85_003832 [Gaertneriomyces sp. JEL0708]